MTPLDAPRRVVGSVGVGSVGVGKVGVGSVGVGVFGSACIAVAAACATVPGPPASDRIVTIDVVGTARFAAPAAYTTRVDGRDVRKVITVVGVGEVLVGDDGCRFARLGDGGSLAVWSHDGACAELRGERLCFNAAGFVDDGGAVRARVDGCAERNEIFLDRIDGDPRVAGLGPRTLVERCADVRARDPAYLHVVDVRVDGNDRPWDGLRLRYDGEAFGVCFLSPGSGTFRVDVVVEDPRPRRVVLEGGVDDL